MKPNFRILADLEEQLKTADYKNVFGAELFKQVKPPNIVLPPICPFIGFAGAKPQYKLNYLKLLRQILFIKDGVFQKSSPLDESKR